MLIRARDAFRAKLRRMASTARTAAILIAIAGCASQTTTPNEADRSRDAIAAGATAPPVAPSRRPVIAKLRLRDADLTIESTGSGPRFSVAAFDGAYVERDLGADELASRYPALYQLYRSAIAGASSAYLDARLDSRIETERARSPKLR